MSCHFVMAKGVRHFTRDTAKFILEAYPPPPHSKNHHFFTCDRQHGRITVLFANLPDLALNLPTVFKCGNVLCPDPALSGEATHLANENSL